MMSEVAELAEFGVLAVVIGMLFSILCIGFKMFMSYIGNQNKYHRESIKNIQENHRQERADWQHEEEKRTLRIESSLNSLAVAIRDQNRGS